MTSHSGNGVKKKVLLGLGCVAVGLYVLACALLLVFEAKFIFLPTEFPPSTTPAVANLAFEDLHIPVDAATQPSSAVILFFHGNGYTLESEAALEVPMLHATGANLLAVDYRGYGSSSEMHTDGPSTEADARAALRYLTGQGHVQLSDIWIAGRSIGTGVATQLAVESAHAAGLVLISPITSVGDVANQSWVYRYLFRPVRWLGHKNDFNNKAKISSVEMPVLVITGTRDQLATPAMAKTLFDRAKAPKNLHLIDGAGHNDILEMGDGALVRAIEAFIGSRSPQANGP
jgi:uncharacterized protein